MQTTAQQTLERIQKHPGVKGVIIAGTEDGAILKSTMSDEATAAHAAQVPMLAGLARAFVRELDPTDEVEIVRLRTARNIELMVAPSECSSGGRARGWLLPQACSLGCLLPCVKASPTGSALSMQPSRVVCCAVPCRGRLRAHRDSGGGGLRFTVLTPAWREKKSR